MGVVKCKLFLFTLEGVASHFIARRRQLESMAALNAVIQRKNKTLMEYVEWFNREGIEV